METEQLDFPQAVEQLAEDNNVELKREREDPEEEQRRQRRERLLALLERATAFYATVLTDSPEAGRARDYLRERGPVRAGAGRLPRGLRAQGLGPAAHRRAPRRASPRTS